VHDRSRKAERMTRSLSLVARWRRHSCCRLHRRRHNVRQLPTRRLQLLLHLAGAMSGCDQRRGRCLHTDASRKTGNDPANGAAQICVKGFHREGDRWVADSQATPSPTFSLQFGLGLGGGGRSSGGKGPTKGTNGAGSKGTNGVGPSNGTQKGSLPKLSSNASGDGLSPLPPQRVQTPASVGRSMKLSHGGTHAQGNRGVNCLRLYHG
jgi:hypothetical protein